MAPPIAPEPPVVVPKQLRWTAGLLILNLALSISVTVISFINREDLVQLMVNAARGGMSAAQAREVAETTLLIRAGTNLLVALMYALLLWGAWRGRRWAWRRMVWLAFAGAAGMIYLLTQPFTPILKAEQAVQLAVLLTLGAVLLHPAIRTHCTKRRRN